MLIRNALRTRSPTAPRNETGATVMTLDELLASVEETQPEPAPEDGWLTTREWAQHWHCSLSKAGASIHLLLSTGKMEWGRQTRQTNIGYAKREPVYRLVKGREV